MKPHPSENNVVSRISWQSWMKRSNHAQNTRHFVGSFGFYFYSIEKWNGFNPHFPTMLCVVVFEMPDYSCSVDRNVGIMFKFWDNFLDIFFHMQWRSSCFWKIFNCMIGAETINNSFYCWFLWHLDIGKNIPKMLYDCVQTRWKIMFNNKRTMVSRKTRLPWISWQQHWLCFSITWCV